MSPLQAEIRAAIASEEPMAVVTIVRGEPLGEKLLVYENGRVSGTLGSSDLDRAGFAAGIERLSDDLSGISPLGLAVDAFVDVFARPPHLVIVGGVHTAIALSQIAKILGFRITVVDARERFASRSRFPMVDDLVVAWPDEALESIKVDSRTYIAILTHDPKFDEPALIAALSRPARYVGAIGSRKTTADRRGRLLERGLTEEQLDRIHAPIGLNIGGKTPEEVALSVAAEIVSVRRGRRPDLTVTPTATKVAEVSA
jgi:xanthine dehydrogenase accessory factor